MAGTWVSRPELIDILGADAARTFTRLMGGMRVYVPKHPDPAHHLARILGLPAFRALVTACGGEYIMLPNNREKESTKKKAFALFCAGRSISQVADECRITMRYAEMLRRVLRDEHNRPRQGSLL